MSKHTPDYVHQHFSEHKDGTRGSAVVPHIICADGASLSVQASSGHYCSPRADTGPWGSVEVWCITSANGRKISPSNFGDDHTGPYGWVPVSRVNAFIHRHGGLKGA